MQLTRVMHKVIASPLKITLKRIKLANLFLKNGTRNAIWKASMRRKRNQSQRLLRKSKRNRRQCWCLAWVTRKIMMQKRKRNVRTQSQWSKKLDWFRTLSAKRLHHVSETVSMFVTQLLKSNTKVMERTCHLWSWTSSAQLVQNGAEYFGPDTKDHECLKMKRSWSWKLRIANLAQTLWMMLTFQT